jgi:hypothetical protein
MPQSLAEELGSIPMSSNLGQSLERAHRFAREQSHKAVTLEHLLLALTEDPEAALILQSANIELARLGTEVSGYLGRLLEDMRSDGKTEPRPDGDLLRVMQAAASAAKQSRRRQIDGAIVLAAIVGDGKSPAAGQLKALGMTFEEAIRALQRANTKARLKPGPKAAGMAQGDAPAAPEPGPRTPDADAGEPASPVTAAGVSQSAEDILAAARARILQRASVVAAKAAPAEAVEAPARAPADEPVDAPEPDEPEAPPEPVEPADTVSLTQAIEAAMSGTAGRAGEPVPSSEASARMPPPAGPLTPPAPPLGQSARPAWTPPQPRPQPAQRLPQPPPARAFPFPARPVAPGEGPRRPPLPTQPAGAGQAQTGFPNRPPSAPWPELGERGTPRAGMPNGALAEAPRAGAERPGARAPQAAWSAAPARAGAHADKGLLVESVPRRMRVGVPASAEVRIARDRVDALIAALNGRAAAPHAQHALARALSVRLRAPSGDFWIEPAAPETQWVESGPSLVHDDYATWRWSVVARRRGRGRLTLMLSVRTLGRDGIAAELAPPDRAIEVKVGGNLGKAAARWIGWMAAVLAGALAGYFHEQTWATARLILDQAFGG